MNDLYSFFDDQQLYTFIALSYSENSDLLKRSWKALHISKPQETTQDLAWLGYYRSSKKLMLLLAETYGTLYRYLRLDNNKIIVYGQQNYLISFRNCNKNICLWEAMLLSHDDPPFEAMSVAAVLESNLRVPLVNDEEKERIRETLRVDRNDISTIETLVLNRIGFEETDDITVLIFSHADVSDIQDDSVPEIIQHLLIRQATWLGFTRRQALLNDHEMYFIGESFNSQTLAYNLEQYLENENFEIKINNSTMLTLTGLTKAGEYQKIVISSPRYLEGKWLWSVKRR